MGLFPEKEPVTNVAERPDEASPLNIERKEVVSSVPTQFKARVKDDRGQNLIETPEDKKIEIKIPESGRESLEEKNKGSKDESPAWSAGFWLRILKKALYFGWKVVFGK